MFSTKPYSIFDIFIILSSFPIFPPDSVPSQISEVSRVLFLFIKLFLLQEKLKYLFISEAVAGVEVVVVVVDAEAAEAVVVVEVK